MKTEELVEIKINKITTDKVLEKIKGFLLSNQQQYLVTINPEMILESQRNDYFKKIINSANIVFADGIGILWALDFIRGSEMFLNKKNDYSTERYSAKNLLNSARFVISAKVKTQNLNRKTSFKREIYISFQSLRNLLQLFLTIVDFIHSLLKLLYNRGHRKNLLQYRTHGIDLIHEICQSDSIQNKKIFLLGSEDGVADKAAVNLKKRYQDVEIVGAEEGMKKNQESRIKNQELIKRINKAKPNIIFVAFGAPKQEIWIYENLEKIPSVKLAIGIGGSFDFISGKIKRAPLFFQKLGLEWIWRLISEPKRIKRIYNATVKFSFIVLKYRINKF